MDGATDALGFFAQHGPAWLLLGLIAVGWLVKTIKYDLPSRERKEEREEKFLKTLEGVLTGQKTSIESIHAGIDALIQQHSDPEALFSTVGVNNKLDKLIRVGQIVSEALSEPEPDVQRYADRIKDLLKD